jgi:mono/diheme cytochrome c family protein
LASLRPLVCCLLFPAACLAADKVTYDDQVFPLFQQSCLNCHNPDKTKGGLDLSSYSGAMKGGSGGKIAEPGDLSSKLMVVCLQTGTPKMPPEGDKLGAAQIAILKGWIEGGLL